MASRRETRLPHAGNPLADAEVQLSDPQTGKFDDGELVKIFAPQESTTGQAVTGTLHPRNVIETDYSLESCLRSYQARKEAANTENVPSFQGPFKRLKKALSEEDRQNEELAREPDPVNDDLGDPTNLATRKTWPSDYRKSATERLAEGQIEAEVCFGKPRPRPRPSPPDNTEKSEGDDIFIALSASPPFNRQILASAPRPVTGQTPAYITLPRYQLDGTDERALDEARIEPVLRQQTSPPTRPVQVLTAQVTQQSLPPSDPLQLRGGSNGSGNFGHIPSPGLPLARTSEFENHTRNERDLSRMSTHEGSDNNEESALIGGSLSARKQPSASITPSSQTGMDLSHLISLLGPDSSSIWSTSGHRPSPLHESSASKDAIPSSKASGGASAREQSLKIDDETTISIHDSSTTNIYRSYLQNHVHAGRLTPLNYGELVPEVLPAGYTNITYLRSTEEKRNKQLQHLAYRLSSLTADDVEQLVQSGYLQTVLEVAKTAWPMFPRVFSPQPFKKSSKAPPICLPRSNADSWPDNIPIDLLEYLATNYLSHADVCNLRLVNKPMSEAFSPIYFRRLVTPFGLGMFAPSQRYGDSVNQFGISFEIDLPGLYKSRNKVSQEMQQSWWGDYTWPKPAYQRFPELKALEDLVDENTPLLKETLQNLPNASELALSIDSGHGWLNGPDLSDMQLWDIRHNGSKVFGKKFKAADKWEEHLRNEVFRWAQQNTINQSIKYLVERSTIENSASFSRTKSKLRWLQSVRVRDYKSFEIVSGQADNDPNQHTGGTPDPPTPGHGQAAQNQLGAVLANAMGNIPGNNHPPPAHVPGQIAPATGAWQAQLQLPQIVPPSNGILPGAPRITATRQRPVGRRIQPGRPRPQSPKKARGAHLPQWPLIFNGYNLSAEVGGQNTYVQGKTAKSTDSRLQPGQLSEAQAQWLMETFWAQRAFLSAYTTSVILNKPNLGKVHALNIAKLSSGLLPILEQHEFWRALPGLRNLTIMISPDWRQEHIPGDQSFQSNMLISPVNASIKLTSFLQHFICNLENLSELSVGFVGGGEHAPGMLSRNQHVIPAPITQEPRLWLSDHHTTPPAQSMISFNHIEKLKFSNCWFSPCMILAFMEKSRDTSLRHLTLDSVSLTAHGASSVGSNGIATPIQALYGREGWLNETLPNKGCWPAILDEMTPSMTFLEQKEALGFHLDEKSQQVLRDKSFRGNVQEITLKSCGYVHISAVMVEELNQSGLLRAQSGSLDDGLFARKQALQTGQSSPRSRRILPANPGNVNIPAVSVADEASGTPQDISGRAMMSTNDAHGHEYFGLGTLTQAVHPVEKRVLEQAWGMRFGWGDDMRRWSAVDDGFYEGGTGRFSGTILK